MAYKPFARNNVEIALSLKLRNKVVIMLSDKLSLVDAFALRAPVPNNSALFANILSAMPSINNNARLGWVYVELFYVL